MVVKSSINDYRGDLECFFKILFLVVKKKVFILTLMSRYKAFIRGIQSLISRYSCNSGGDNFVIGILLFALGKKG